MLMFSRVVFVFALVAALMILLVGPFIEPVYSLSSAASRPNVLFIRTDDQAFRDMDATLPNGEYVMKNVRSLIANKGVTFSNSFVSFALCCPSRATSITGQYAHNTKILSNYSPHGGYRKLDDTNTLPVWLQQAGYYTLHIGKYMNGYELTGPGWTTYVPPGWSKWFTLILDDYLYYNYSVNEDGQIIWFGNTASDYQTDVLTRKAQGYLIQQPYGDRPFFMLLDYMAPHVQSVGTAEVIPALRHIGVMGTTPLPTPPSFNEADVSDKPQRIRNFPLMSSTVINTIALKSRARLESLLAVDEGVGKIISTLQQTGQYDNTIIVFTSDNGFQFGEHRISFDKQYPYESTQVPLYMSGPGIPAGVTVPKYVTNVDYASTILDIADARGGIEQEGRSLLSLIQNPSRAWRRDFLIENPINQSYSGLRVQYPDGREYLYVEYDYPAPGAPMGNGIVDERELYNLTPDECNAAGDPYHLQSQHNNSCYSSRIVQFHNRLAELKTCVGASCR